MLPPQVRHLAINLFYNPPPPPHPKTTQFPTCEAYFHLCGNDCRLGVAGVTTIRHEEDEGGLRVPLLLTLLRHQLV